MRATGGAETDIAADGGAWVRLTPGRGSWRVSGRQSWSAGHRIRRGPGVPDDGVFAAWRWDGSRLAVDNDRYGLQPLFYFRTEDGGLCISPSVRTLLDLGAPRRLDDDALAVFLRAGYFVGDDTPFAAIKAVPPGATLETVGEPGAGERLHWASSPAAVRPQALSREAAVAGYIELFRQAITRRRPRGADLVVPLSGGRDSRHILLDLVEQGARPRCLTVRHYPPRPNDDARIAAALAARVGLEHAVLETPARRVAAERRKNELTHFCCDEHVQFLPLADCLTGSAAVVFDGIGGDVLSQSSYLRQELLALVEAGRWRALADAVLDAGGNDRIDGALRALLTPGAAARFTRERAVARVIREVERHAAAANPIGSFYFWNRTRREVALAPYALLRHLPAVYSPFLDADLYDFLASLPAAILLDRRLHTETIERAYPARADIPFDDRGGEPEDARSFFRRYARELARSAVPIARSRLMRAATVLPRLATSALDGRDRLWVGSPVIYLLQVEEIIDSGMP
jgi:asparagine synthase (glutamine-hydrolysing)